MASGTGSNLRVALLGAGNIATTHLAALRQLTGVEIVGVSDLNYQRATAFQKQAGIPNAYADLDTMLRECKPQIVHVLLPPTAHCEAAVKCLEAGSHAFVEKPFCVTVEECYRVRDLAKSMGLKVGVNHNLAFMPGMMRLIEEIRNLRLGAVEHVAMQYTIPMPGLAKAPATHWMFGESGRIMLELGPHPVSIVCRLLGPVKSACTAVSGEITLLNKTRFFSTWMSSLVCERGTASLTLSTGGGYSSGSVQVNGQDGTAYVDLTRNTIRISEKNRFIRAGGLVDGLGNGLSVAGQGLQNFIAYGLGATGMAKPYDLQVASVTNSVENFYNAVRRGEAPTVSADEGTAVIEACWMIIDGALRYATEGHSIAAGR
ncbi:MAG TPA: Gfo/Idh/MocA family oxidoreductase [Bryobacteraceae bacterium]|jgi:predicted dehydrogenase|nr:Gfo/Idh/MocA family oxidoreductase [Bryobacteraceae bacterium]